MPVLGYSFDVVDVFPQSRPPDAGVSGHVEWACLSAILSTPPSPALEGFVQMDSGSRGLVGLPVVS